MKASPRVGIGRMTKEMFNARCATDAHPLDTFKQVFNTAQYKIDGFGARFGFDEAGKFFFETSKSGILYDSAEIVAHTANNYKNESKEKFERGMKRAVVYADLMDTLKTALTPWGNECKGEKVFIEVLARDLDEEPASSPTSTFVKSQYSKEIFLKDEEKFLLFFHMNGAEDNSLCNILKKYPVILSPNLVFIENKVKFGIEEKRFIPDRFDLDITNITPWDILISRLAMTMFDNCFAKEGIIFYLDDTPYKILSQDWNDTSPLPDDAYSFNILYPGKFAPLHRGHIEDVIAYEKNIERISNFVPKFIPCIIGDNYFYQYRKAEWMTFLIDNLACTSTFKNFTQPLFADDAYLPNIIKKYQRENHHAILGVVCGQDRLKDYERMIKEMPMNVRVVDCINKNPERKYSGTSVRQAIQDNNYAAFVDMVFPVETGGRSNASNPAAFKMFKSLRKSLDNK